VGTVKLRPDPFFFGVINIEEIVDVMPNRGRNKLGDVVLHELLYRIQEVRKPFIAPSFAKALTASVLTACVCVSISSVLTEIRDGGRRTYSPIKASSGKGQP
jgi:hypothetical protein